MMTHPAAVCALAILLPLQEPEGTAEDRVLKLVAERFQGVDASQRSVYETRVKSAIERHRESGLGAAAAQRAEHWIQSWTHRLDTIDEFRGMAARDPELKVLALPDSSYHKVYESVVSLLETELRTGVARGPDPAETEVLRAQIEDLSSRMRTLLAQKVHGGFAPALIERKVRERSESLKGIIGRPFSGIHRLLTPEEFNDVLEDARRRIDGLSPLVVDRPELGDPNLASGAESSGEDPEKSTFRRAMIIYEQISGVLDSFGMVFDKHNPAVARYREELEGSLKECRSWVRSAAAAHEHLYLRAIARERREASKGRFAVPPAKRAGPEDSTAASDPEGTPEKTKSQIPASTEGNHRPPVFWVIGLLAIAGLLIFFTRRKPSPPAQSRR